MSSFPYQPVELAALALGWPAHAGRPVRRRCLTRARQLGWREIFVERARLRRAASTIVEPQALAVLLAHPALAPLPVEAQAPTALTGEVISSEGGAMEGVLVSARKVGSTITVTVVSDAQGRYRFPASKLDPGRYELGIRAVG